MSMKRAGLSLAVLAGIAVFGGMTSSAEAGWGIRIGHSSHSGHFGRSYNDHGYGYGRSNHYGHGRRGHYDYHDTSHYDYHPGGYQRHGNHYDYVPGHYDYHRTGHYDYHRGH